jgi:alpha-D-ribose 1-methylphosphonate 5-triphosphate synthase subunit PhnG
MMSHSEIASEAGAEAVRRIAELVAERLPVKVLRAPAPAMVMVRQVDPLENLYFHLGEAFVTECEVEVDGHHGYGCVLGPADDRALCSALLDAVFTAGHPIVADIEPLLAAEERRISAERERESRAVATTRVSFEVQ